MARSLNPRQAPERPKYLTIREVAALLRVDHKTIRSAITDGRIPVIRLGRVIRIDVRVLDSLETQARVAMPERGDPRWP